MTRETFQLRDERGGITIGPPPTWDAGAMVSLEGTFQEFKDNEFRETRFKDGRLVFEHVTTEGKHKLRRTYDYRVGEAGIVHHYVAVGHIWIRVPWLAWAMFS